MGVSIELAKKADNLEAPQKMQSFKLNEDDDIVVQNHQTGDLSIDSFKFGTLDNNVDDIPAVIRPLPKTKADKKDPRLSCYRPLEDLMSDQSREKALENDNFGGTD